MRNVELYVGLMEQTSSIDTAKDILAQAWYSGYFAGTTVSIPVARCSPIFCRWT